MPISFKVEVFDSKKNFNYYLVGAENVSEARRIARNKHIMDCSRFDADYKTLEKLPQIFTEILNGND